MGLYRNSCLKWKVSWPKTDPRETRGEPESADTQLQVLVSQSMGVSQDVRA